MRGNRRAAAHAPPPTGSIPAYAGKPQTGSIEGAREAVYPRVCGETGHACGSGDGAHGLSPRMRGNPYHPQAGFGAVGSIPAYAGKPAGGTPRLPGDTVYPRVCGETPVMHSVDVAQAGLSPRMRGNLRKIGKPGCGLGSIPAYAGKPCSASRSRRRSRVYPRVCGETRVMAGRWRRWTGLSPRMRGNQRPKLPAVRKRGSIPAYAGKPRL